MGRPPLPVGTAGSITVNPVATGGYEARCRFRDLDGITRAVERRGKSRQAARAALNEHLRVRKRAAQGDEITGDTLFGDVASLWWEGFEELVAAGRRSPENLASYSVYLNSDVLPAIAALRVREVTVGRVDALIKSVKKRRGIGAASSARAVVSNVMALAVRHDAISHNPAREIEPVSTATPKKPARALTLEEVSALRGKLLADELSVRRGLPDLVDFMLATGLRIGEAAAMAWAAVDLEAGTAEVRGTVVRIKGQGMTIKPRPKTASGYRTLELPSWAVRMLEARKIVQDANPWGTLFTTTGGKLIDPGNLSQEIRQVLDKRIEDEQGELRWPIFDWVTTHVFRKTVLTLMDIAGLPARAAADQAGHANVAMTQNVYFGRRVARTGAAGVLEGIVERR